MQSKAMTVEDYLVEAPKDREAALRDLREACLHSLKGFDEAMEYGMPSYKRNGVVEVAFASQKNYISLYILRTDVMTAHREQLAGVSVGKGCIRYSRREAIDLGIVRQLLSDTRKSKGRVC